MFQNPRYLTKGIEVAVPIVVQQLLWQCIDAMPEPKDYLQVFELGAINGMQRICHKSEQPSYRMEYLLPTPEPITAKIYVIDDNTHSTMLLAEEY